MVARASQSLGGFQTRNFKVYLTSIGSPSFYHWPFFFLQASLIFSPPPPIPSHLIILREGKKGSFDSQPHSQVLILISFCFLERILHDPVSVSFFSYMGYLIFHRLCLVFCVFKWN